MTDTERALEAAKALLDCELPRDDGPHHPYWKAAGALRTALLAVRTPDATDAAACHSGVVNCSQCAAIAAARPREATPQHAGDGETATQDVEGSIPSGTRTGDSVEAVDGERGADPVSRSAGKCSAISTMIPRQ